MSLPQNVFRLYPDSFRAVRLWRLLWLLALLVGGTGGVRAASPPAARLIVLLVPGLRAEDLTRPDTPMLRRLIAEGASGWMVCRAARVTDSHLLRPDGRETTDSLLLTLGSGTRAVAGPEIAALNAPSASPNKITAALQALQARNARLDHPVLLGALGDMLHRAHLQTAALGDADTDTPDRAGFLVAMDSAGRVDFTGDSPAEQRDDASAPYGFRAETQALAQEAMRLEPRAALLVLTFGDLARADRYAPLCLPTMAAAHRTAALRSLNDLLSVLYGHLQPERAGLPPDFRTLCCVLAPGQADSVSERQDRFAPVILWGTDIVPGRLTSASTRRDGLVVNTDFLATAADLFGLPLPSGATGRPMVHATASGAASPSPESLRALHDSLVSTARLQIALGGLPTVQMLLALAGLAALYRQGSRRLIAATSLAIVSLPLGMLILPPMAPSTVWGASTLLMLFTLALAGWGWRLSAVEGVAERLFTGLCAALAVVLCADLLTGSHLLRQAWMSYSAAEGARFYGIGNEYMGAAIGAACVLLGQERKSAKGHLRLVPWLLALLCGLLLIGMGVFGAKVGAIPSAGAAFGVALIVRRFGRLRLRDLLLILAAAGLLLGGLAVLDLHHAAGEQSHFARAIGGEGGGSLLAIAQRKLALEGYLLLHSPWSATLIVCAVGLVWLTRRFPQRFASRSAKAALAGLVAGAIASLLCNDSGVTAAALVLLYGWAWAILRASSGCDEAQAQDSPAPPPNSSPETLLSRLSR